MQFEAEFRAIHALVKPLLVFDKWRFRADVLGFSAAVWACALTAYFTSSWILVVAMCLVGGCFFYHAATLIHELSHHSRELKLDAVLWNVLIGVPFLAPSFLYTDSHLQHHSKEYFSSSSDPEYDHYAAHGKGAMLLRLAQAPLLPLVAPLRFLLMAPLSALSPRLRREIRLRFSTLSLKIPFKRASLPAREDNTWLVLETVTAVYVLLVAAGLFAGIFSWKIVAIWYVFVAMAETLNAIRALGGTHGYRHASAGLDFRLHLEDSFNIESRSWTHRLLFPHNLQYHALHHMFPKAPYHRLPEAHALLMATLPPDSFYRRSSLSTLWRGFGRVFENIAAHREGARPHRLPVTGERADPGAGDVVGLPQRGE